MMTRLNPLITAGAAFLACGATVLVSAPRQQAPFTALQGSLYSAAVDSATATANSAQQRLEVAVAPEVAPALTEDSDYLTVRLVPAGSARFLLTTAALAAQRRASDLDCSPKDSSVPRALPPRKPRDTAVHKAGAGPSRRLPQAEQSNKAEPPDALPPPAAVVAPVPAAIPVALPAVAPSLPAPAPAADPPPASASVERFEEIVRGDPTTQALNARLKKGRVTFKVTSATVWRDRYLLRAVVTNEEAADFFVSIITVFADGEPILSETVMPFSCHPDSEIAGFVHFSRSLAAHKRISVELVQSGGNRRRLRIDLDRGF